MEIFNVTNALLLYIVLPVVISAVITASDEDEIRQLPYCGPSSDVHHKLVFVSTLDGRLSALDATDEGTLSWSVDTGPGPMLSSSIHNVEMLSNGQRVRIIPSLSGGIYRFNGTSIEPIPITADTLLQTTPYIFSKELVVSGGKESRSYGVVMNTGRVVYECTMDGCVNSTENIDNDEEMLVIQRQTQTIRAVEARTGSERWNFSVGLHELRVLSSSRNGCIGTRPIPIDDLEDMDLKVVVPEGLICAVSKSSGHILWKHRFTSPVVSAWHFIGGEMQPINLFSGEHWSANLHEHMGAFTPYLYIGMHNKQLYIQESVTSFDKIGKMSTQIIPSAQRYHQATWALIPATGTALGLTRPDSTALQTRDLSALATSLLSSLDVLEGNGLYLFQEAELKCHLHERGNETHDRLGTSETVNDIGTENEMFSLWYYWKEVLVISISTALLVNILLMPRVMPSLRILPLTRHEILQQEIIVVEKPVPMLVSEDEAKSSQRSFSDPGTRSSRSSEGGYTSRYLDDFEPLYCLGKGGFGVVFEAKNKIDDCHYAIKRIPLSNRPDARDRVMREVKALAKLDHHNIVRYFNAWMECPPPGWQEEHDKLVPNREILSFAGATSTDLTGHSKSTIPSEYTSPKKQKKEALQLPFTAVNLELEDEGSVRKATDPDNSDSFIVFEHSNNEDSDATAADDTEDLQKDGESGVGCEITTSASCVSALSEEAHRKRTYSNTILEEKHRLQRAIGHQRPRSLDLTSLVTASHRTPRTYLYIQMQLCRRESLKDWLRDNNTHRDISVVLGMFNQIVQAVEYVHIHGLIHRDLKPSNIFFSMDGQIKVGDFGLVTAMVEGGVDVRTPSPEAKLFFPDDGKHTARVGTQLYMSPEQALGLPYSYKVDIYSLGVILFELLVPFTTEMERGHTLTDLRQNKFPQDFQPKFPEEFKLLQMMLSHKPDERPTVFGIRAHPPLKQFSNGLNIDEKFYFEMPPLKRQISKTSSLSHSSSTESWDHI